MKTFLNLITAITLVLFMSACGSSGGGGDSGSTGDGSDYTQGGGTAIENAVESGRYTSSFNGAPSKTWYTWKVQSAENYIINTASHNDYEGSESISDAIMVGATSSVGTDASNGTLLFTLYFPSGVTTGNLVVGQVQYQDTKDATRYTYLQGMQGADIVANITTATKENGVIHIKGSFEGTIYDGMDNAGNPQNPKSISVNFEFDAHSASMKY